MTNVPPADAGGASSDATHDIAPIPYVHDPGAKRSAAPRSSGILTVMELDLVRNKGKHSMILPDNTYVVLQGRYAMGPAALTGTYENEVLSYLLRLGGPITDELFWYFIFGLYKQTVDLDLTVASNGGGSSLVQGSASTSGPLLGFGLEYHPAAWLSFELRYAQDDEGLHDSELTATVWISRYVGVMAGTRRMDLSNNEYTLDFSGYHAGLAARF